MGRMFGMGEYKSPAFILSILYIDVVLTDFYVIYAAKTVLLKRRVF